MLPCSVMSNASNCEHIQMQEVPCWQRLKLAYTTIGTSVAPILDWARFSAFTKRRRSRFTNGNAFYARIERNHEILDGFANTNWIPGAEYRLPVKPVSDPILTVVPGYVAYPPELSYPPTPRTNEPGVVIQEKSKSRLVYFPGDIEPTLWRSGHTDLSRLLQNSVRWLLRGKSPVQVKGDGVVELFAWETEAGFAVHVLNYTNPAMHRGWIRRFYPIVEQKVHIQLPPGRRVTRVELLRAETDVRFHQTDEGIEFTIPTVVDYEVGAINAA